MGAFEGNRAETQTMLPMIRRLAEAYRLDDITVVADAGMFSAGKKQAIIDAGLDYILGVKTPDIPYPVAQWREKHPGKEYTDGQIWSFADRARRTRKGIHEQLQKAQRAVDGKAPVKKNRYIDLKALYKRVNHALAEKHLALAGIKGYETNRVDLAALDVIGFYRKLFAIEKSFRMAKSDLKARPIFHRKQDSIHAHLTIVMTAMACGHVLEQASGLSLKRLVRTLRKYRSFTLSVHGQTVHAHTPVPGEVTKLIGRLPKPD